MAQTGYTPILIYASGTTGNTPSASNLTSSASGAELALNYFDGKLFYKDASGNVQVLAGKGGSGVVAGSNTQVQFNNNGVFGASSGLTWDGTNLTASQLRSSGLTSGRVTYASTSGLLVDSANMTFNGTRLTVADLADSGLTSGRVTYASTGGALVDSASLTFDGTTLVAANFTDSSLTSGRVTYAGTGGNLTDNANFVFDGTNLGIGTASPVDKLDVYVGSTANISAKVGNNTGAVQLLQSNGIAYIYTASNQPLGLSTNNIERVRITAAGNVGIGTDSPSTKLDVAYASGWGPIVTRSLTQFVGLSSDSSAGANDVIFSAGTPLRLSTMATSAGGTYTERARIDSIGNFGIGTSSVSEKLEVNGAGKYTNNATNFSGGAEGTIIDFVPGSVSRIGHVNGASGSAKPLQFLVGSNPVMALNAQGFLGVGTTSPAHRLDVNGNARFQTRIAYGGTGNTGGSANWWYIGSIDLSDSVAAKLSLLGTASYSAGSPIAGETIIQLRGDNTAGGSIGATGYFYGVTQGNGLVSAVAIKLSSGRTYDIWVKPSSGFSSFAVIADGVQGYTPGNQDTGSASQPSGSTSLDSYWTFATSGYERARIDSSGNLLVGGTNALGQVTSISNGSKFQFASHNTDASGASQISFRFVRNGSDIGSITTTGTSTSYNTSSDYRLKENIQPMTGALAKVAALKPCTYKWKVDGSDGEGFIAHELAEVCPQAVTGEKDAVDSEGNPQYQGIDTSFLVATLTAAIQELKAEFDAYKATHP